MPGWVCNPHNSLQTNNFYYEKPMKFFNVLPVLVFSIALAACSGAPSDSDVQAVAKQSEQQLDQQLAPLGVRSSDIFETNVKIKNKAKQEDGRWLVEVESTVTAKKDIKDLPESAQMVIFSMVGDIKKGQVIGGGAVSTSSFHMQKGDNGWMATR